jgi:hypothetical protein
MRLWVPLVLKGRPSASARGLNIRVRNTHFVLLVFLMQFLDMGMKHPLPTFTTLVEHARDAYPNMAFVHVVEPRIDGTIVSGLDDENCTQ